MCIHALTIFACSHAQWGTRQRACIIGQDFEDGHLPEDCVFKAPHGLKSTRSSRMCNDCASEEIEPRTPDVLSLVGEEERENSLDIQMERAAREERERRFQEEKARLGEIKRLKKDVLACYDNVPSAEEYSDSWIYSEYGEIKTSSRGETFHADDVQEDSKSQADSAVGLGISCSEDGSQTSFSSPPTAKRTGIPRSAPKSRLAIPVRKPPPQHVQATSTFSLPSEEQTTADFTTSSASKWKKPRANSKSRLAVPVSKPAPRYVPTSGTPSKSMLPKPGFRTRKQRDSGCSFGSSVGSSN